ncbi:MAG: Xaa-Pro aminopeptidase [Planctomycetota bacterium]|jgi:Xaa-Pro aminopeptidase
MSISPYAAHRTALLERLTRDQIAAVIPTATTKVRNDDSDYRFRPHSDFYYLTGFAEPSSCLVLLPARDDRPARSILFLRERDKEREIWDGRRLGIERATGTIGVDEARDIETLWDELPNLLSDHEQIMWRLGDGEDQDRRMTMLFAGLRDRARGSIRPATTLVDPGPYVSEMRLFKTEGELDKMRKAAQLTAETHTSLMAKAAPGMNEAEAEAFLDYSYRKAGGTGAAYGHICAGGANACILHYIENNEPLQDGDLMLVDSGAEWDFYAADITRTFPVNGKFSPEQRALYEIVLRAEEASIEKVRPGVPFDEVHAATLEIIVDGLIDLGLLKGTAEEALDSGAYRAFFMHKTSHWLGLDVHDCGTYTKDGKPRPLEPGMVLTVEPGIYVDPENEDVEERWRGIGIRIEDDVLVTETGHEILTAAAPKSIVDVEAACAGSVGHSPRETVRGGA